MVSIICILINSRLSDESSSFEWCDTFGYIYDGKSKILEGSIDDMVFFLQKDHIKCKKLYTFLMGTHIL